MNITLYKNILLDIKYWRKSQGTEKYSGLSYPGQKSYQRHKFHAGKKPLHEGAV